MPDRPSFGSPGIVSTLEEPSTASIVNGLTNPMVVGKYKKNLYHAHKFVGRVTHIELQMIIDNFITEDNITCSFIGQRRLHIRRAHPQFMQFVDQQQDLIIDKKRQSNP